jgi:hypothetical protein
LTNGNSYLVREKRSEVVARIISYRQQIFRYAVSFVPDEVEIGLLNHGRVGRV